MTDYSMSLRGLPEGSVEKDLAMHEVHRRNANRLKEVCFANGGIYIKLGQHIGQLVGAHLSTFQISGKILRAERG